MKFTALVWAAALMVLLPGCGPEKEKRVLLFADKSSGSKLSLAAMVAIDSYIQDCG